MTSMTQDFNFFQIFFLDIFVSLVTFELLSAYAKIIQNIKILI